MSVTPYYSRNGIAIYHGDCMDVLPRLPVSSVNLVFTSPPYNMGISSGGGLKGGLKSGKWAGAALARGYGEHDDAMPVAEYEDWQRGVLTECWRLIKPAGAIYYNHKPRVQDGALWTPLSLNPGLPVRQIVIWARAGGINFAPTHYLPTHEWIVIFADPRFRLKSKEASGIGDVWYVPQETNTDHPAPFPVALPSKAIETVDPDIILDPFMGSGTTLRAAKNFGKRAIGIEINERFCELAARRLSQEVLPLEIPA